MTVDGVFTVKEVKRFGVEAHASLSEGGGGALFKSLLYHNIVDLTDGALRLDAVTTAEMTQDSVIALFAERLEAHLMPAVVKGLAKPYQASMAAVKRRASLSSAAASSKKLCPGSGAGLGSEAGASAAAGAMSSVTTGAAAARFNPHASLMLLFAQKLITKEQLESSLSALQ